MSQESEEKSGERGARRFLYFAVKGFFLKANISHRVLVPLLGTLFILFFPSILLTPPDIGASISSILMLLATAFSVVAWVGFLSSNSGVWWLFGAAALQLLYYDVAYYYSDLFPNTPESGRRRRIWIVAGPLFFIITSLVLGVPLTWVFKLVLYSVTSHAIAGFALCAMSVLIILVEGKILQWLNDRICPGCFTAVRAAQKQANAELRRERRQPASK
jgi:hypothetical protein